MEQTAGTLLYRQVAGNVEVLLVHPSGNYNRRAPWSIPKGVPEGDESLEETARRETCEETGMTAGELFSLGFSDYRSRRKRVHCFAGPASDALEPRCASWEVDRAEFVVLDQARELLHPDQKIFVDRLVEKLGS